MATTVPFNESAADAAMASILEILDQDSYAWENPEIANQVNFLSGYFGEKAGKAKSEKQQTTQHFLSLAMAKLTSSLQEQAVARARREKRRKKENEAEVEEEGQEKKEEKQYVMDMF